MSALSSGEWRGMCYLDKMEHCKGCKQPLRREARRTPAGTMEWFWGRDAERKWSSVLLKVRGRGCVKGRSPRGLWATRGETPSDGIKWFCEVALGPALAEAFLIVSFLAGPGSSAPSTLRSWLCLRVGAGSRDLAWGCGDLLEISITTDVQSDVPFM